MGLLGGVLKSVGNIVKSVAPSVVKALAPAASKLLKGVVGDAFQVGGNFLKAGLNALPLPSPLKSIAQKLLGAGLDKLQNLAQGGVDKLVQNLANSILKRLVPGAGNIALPPASSPERQAEISNPANNPSVGSQTGAATAGGTTSTGGASGSTQTTGSGGVSNPSAPTFSGTDDKMPQFQGDPTSISDQNKHNERMFKYQQAMSMMQQFWQQMSTIQKSNDDTKKAIAQNFR